MEEELVVVNNQDELLSALKNQAHFIRIEGDYKEDFLEDTDIPLSENEKMPLELGFRGTAGLGGEIFYQIINAFSKEEKEQKQIDSKVRQYTVERLSDGVLLLSANFLRY